MQGKDNYLNNAELSTEQNCSMIDGIPNNANIYGRLLSHFETEVLTWMKM